MVRTCPTVKVVAVTFGGREVGMSNAFKEAFYSDSCRLAKTHTAQRLSVIDQRC